MGTSSILKFTVNDTGTNLLSDAQYLAASDRTNGNQPGIASSKLVNKGLRQASMMAAGLAEWAAARQASNIDDTLTSTQIAAILSAASAFTGSSVKGLRGNTVGAGFTTATFSASEVTLRNPTTGAPYLFLNVGPTVCNVALAGPAANGRDQVAAFGNNSWVHFWYITDGTTLATLASTSASAPTLPAGYVGQAYIGAVRFGTGVLADVDFYGSNTVYNASQIALTNGTATTLTAVNVAAFVPPNAMKFDVLIRDFVATPNGGTGITDVTQTLAVSTTGSMFRLGFGSIQSSAGNVTTGGQLYPLPNFGQQYYYLVASGASNPVSSTHHISGYKNPNGGE